MIYLASPYSSPDPIIRKTRFLIAQNFVLHALREWGQPIFSPIVYWHEMADLNKLPTEAADWMAFNMGVLRHVTSCYSLELRGHEESKGMKVELNVCKILRIPILRFGEDFMQVVDTGEMRVN